MVKVDIRKRNKRLQSSLQRKRRICMNGVSVTRSVSARLVSEQESRFSYCRLLSFISERIPPFASAEIRYQADCRREQGGRESRKLRDGTVVGGRTGYSTVGTVMFSYVHRLYMAIQAVTRTHRASIRNQRQARDGLDELGFAAAKLWNVAR